MVRTILKETPVFIIVPQRVARFVTSGHTPYWFNWRCFKRVVAVFYNYFENGRHTYGMFYREIGVIKND